MTKAMVMMTESIHLSTVLHSQYSKFCPCLPPKVSSRIGRTSPYSSFVASFRLKFWEINLRSNQLIYIYAID
jgi:hypothetical protein